MPGRGRPRRRGALRYAAPRCGRPSQSRGGRRRLGSALRCGRPGVGASTGTPPLLRSHEVAAVGQRRSGFPLARPYSPGMGMSRADTGPITAPATRESTSRGTAVPRPRSRTTWASRQSHRPRSSRAEHRRAPSTARSPQSTDVGHHPGAAGAAPAPSRMVEAGGAVAWPNLGKPVRGGTRSPVVPTSPTACPSAPRTQSTAPMATRMIPMVHRAPIPAIKPMMRRMRPRMIMMPPIRRTPACSV